MNKLSNNELQEVSGGSWWLLGGMALGGLFVMGGNLISKFK
jgi:lactobin A/cerein 7B family class IIb bacteriocin